MASGVRGSRAVMLGTLRLALRTLHSRCVNLRPNCKAGWSGSCMMERLAGSQSGVVQGAARRDFAEVPAKPRNHLTGTLKEDAVDARQRVRQTARISLTRPGWSSRIATMLGI